MIPRGSYRHPRARENPNRTRRGHDETIRLGENMKLSVEMKVAAAIGAVFMALTLGAIAQGRSGGQSSGPNNYRPMNGPRHTSQQGYE